LFARRASTEQFCCRTHPPLIGPRAIPRSLRHAGHPCVPYTLRPAVNMLSLARLMRTVVRMAYVGISRSFSQDRAYAEGNLLDFPSQALIRVGHK
jgi:hypothetical protein